MDEDEIIYKMQNENFEGKSPGTVRKDINKVLEFKLLLELEENNKKRRQEDFLQKQ